VQSITIVSGILDRVSCPAGTVKSVDLNSGVTRANAVFACIKTTSAATATVLQDVLAVLGIATSCPQAYTKLAGNLNDGATGSPAVLLCVLGELLFGGHAQHGKRGLGTT
jgi:hypothetical protein